MEYYLQHYGIAGQKWGVRRFQNEDGTLTEEGKRRYYDSLTDNQRKIFDRKMTDGQRKRVMEKLSEGKSWSQSVREMTNETRAKYRTVTGIALATGLTLASPAVRTLLKAAGKQMIGAIKNSGAAQKGKLYLQRMLKRRQMVKNGAVTLKKSAYSVRDIPFGGYLR